jgi:hypothetical protein
LIWILLECISTKFALHQPDENWDVLFEIAPSSHGIISV